MTASPLDSSFLHYFGKNGTRRGTLREMAKDLSTGIFNINISRVVEEEMTPLAKFLGDKQVLGQVRTLVLTAKPSSLPTSQIRSKKNKRDTTECSALLFEELFNLLCRFVSLSSSLHTLILDQIVTFESKHFRSLSLALGKSKTLRWLCVRKCNLGDTGLCYLTRPLINIPFQVLILESCGLTDKACPMLSSVLRAHEASRDVMAWNAFLRASPEELRSAEAWSERGQIQASGLMLLSVKGNQITSSGLSRLQEAVRTNCWLLGLKLSSNQVSRRGLLNFLDGLTEHCGLEALVLDGNPGFTESIRSRAVDKLNPASSTCLPEACHALLQRWKYRQKTGLSTPSGAGTASATASTPATATTTTPEGHTELGLRPPVELELDAAELGEFTPGSSNSRPDGHAPVDAHISNVSSSEGIQNSPPPAKSVSGVYDTEELTDAERAAVQEALRAKILQYMRERLP